MGVSGQLTVFCSLKAFGYKYHWLYRMNISEVEDLSPGICYQLKFSEAKVEKVVITLDVVHSL